MGRGPPVRPPCSCGPCDRAEEAEPGDIEITRLAHAAFDRTVLLESRNFIERGRIAVIQELGNIQLRT